MQTKLRCAARGLATTGGVLGAVAMLGAASHARAASPDLVISQVYGGGGNTGATYKNDFIELFNRGTSPVTLAGWSVQYASSTGTSWALTLLSGTLQPGQFYLVQEAVGAGGTLDLPTPDATGTLAMSGSTGKVALARQTTALSGACPTTNVVDLVGYGTANCAEGTPTGALSNATAALRINACVDGDNNAAEFQLVAPNPRNTSAAPGECGAVPASCDAADTPIGAIQGTGDSAALTGVQTVEGVVVADFEYPGSGSASDHLRGFYLQNLPAQSDGNPASSDGIFVFNAGSNSVSVGQVVQVTGTISEFDYFSTGGTLTEITASSITQCGSTANLAPSPIALPLPNVAELERHEGMLVSFAQKLYVTEHFQLGRFGQVLLSGSARLPQPTKIAAPGAAALAQQAANDLNQIVLDDELQAQNPDPIRYGRGGLPLSASNTLRGGDSLAGLTGVLTQTDATTASNVPAATDPVRYRVRPWNVLNPVAVSFVAENERPAVPPVVAGRLRVMGANVLNYFNTFGAGACSYGLGGGAADCRGASNAAEFLRQSDKLVREIERSGADIIALSEIENDGYGVSSAIQDLVSKLDAATAPGSFAFIDADARTTQVNALGTDAIKVGIVYRTARVTPIGRTAVLNTGAFGQYQTGSGTIGRNRPALAQAFKETDPAAGTLTVVANHLKSKGSSCADNISPAANDVDTGDGQGECNQTRLLAATQLASWLASNPTNVGTQRVLIMGDLNAYAKEDPITSLRNAGYTDLVERNLGAQPYSYVFDGQWGYLDHALASSGLLSAVAEVREWHVNADEPVALDYNLEFKSAGQQTSLYAADVFRSSDHDPVIIGLNLPVTGGAPVPLLGGKALSVLALLLLGVGAVSVGRVPGALKRMRVSHTV